MKFMAMVLKKVYGFGHYSVLVGRIWIPFHSELISSTTTTLCCSALSAYLSCYHGEGIHLTRTLRIII
jgi:hypothetical protein